MWWDAFIGEMRLFAGSFAPAGWALCQGQALAIKDNKDLFSLIGTTYGGDGRNTFCLPNLSARLPVGRSDAAPPGMSKAYPLGVAGGQFAVALPEAAMPTHTHALNASTGTATTVTPSPEVTFASVPANATLYAHSSSPTTLEMAGSMYTSVGDGAAHENMMPSLGLNYIICLKGGVFPEAESASDGEEL
ncbi:phage tail protein [Ancylobacter sp. IITR112]|uniref:phage tail protein n=1 Tax=Ancylobacter sp. IITR112 TaxID=3138073 RepID=UPI00352B434C